MDRAAWMQSLFSTDPADQPRAEAAVRAFYRALDLEPPQHILWFESPSAAAWAALLLLSYAVDAYAGLVFLAEQKSEQRAALERARERLGQINPGPSLQQRLTGKRLFTDRLTLYPDLQSFQRASILTDDDDLYRAENLFRGPVRGVIGDQENVPGLINRSLLSAYPMSRMVADEVQAAGGPVPPLLEALWEIARSSGPWWAFEHAVLLTDRPCEVHLNDLLEPHSPDGPAILYRDGWPVFAWEGQAVDQPGRPEAQLGFDAQGNLRMIPIQSELKPKPVSKPGRSFLDRYLDGECKEVWDELIALGPAVRKPPHYLYAPLVAEETMRRVAVNVDNVIRRLEYMGYRFRMRTAAHIPPGEQTHELLKKLDSLAGPAPLSLAAFYKIVGSVDLSGYHAQLTATSGGYLLPDPLVVFPLEQILREYDAGVNPNFGRVCISSARARTDPALLSKSDPGDLYDSHGGRPGTLRAAISLTVMMGDG